MSVSHRRFLFNSVQSLQRAAMLLQDWQHSLADRTGLCQPNCRKCIRTQSVVPDVVKEIPADSIPIHRAGPTGPIDRALLITVCSGI